MRKAIILTLMLMCAPASLTLVSAQQNGITASLGGATYRMDDLKYLQGYILESYPVEGSIVSSFPPYATASFGLLRQWFPMVKIGAGYTYSSTGGKSDYSDYSGTIYTIMVARSHRLGVFVSYSLFGNDHLDFSLFGRVDANITSLDITSVINAGGYSNGLINKYRSVSPNGSAGLELMYRFSDLAIGIDAGYLVDLPGELSEDGNELSDPADSRRVLTADWTGWRANLKAVFWLKE